ncbi:protein phosphatase 1 regulatory subunit 3C-like [Glandiceps talaboti]
MGDVWHFHQMDESSDFGWNREELHNMFTLVKKFDFNCNRLQDMTESSNTSQINALLRSFDVETHLSQRKANVKAAYSRYDGDGDGDGDDDDVFHHTSQIVPISHSRSENSVRRLPKTYRSHSDGFKLQEPLLKARIRRRSLGSCLKSSDTPSSPRKQVRFADSIGLNLVETTSHFIRHDGEDDVGDVDNHRLYFHSFSLKEEKMCHVPSPITRGELSLYPCFDQPGALPDFIDTVHAQKVCLENVEIGKGLTIQGSIRVANIGLLKNVKVRFTTNDWKRYYDLPAFYVDGSSDGQTDRFTFQITAPSNFVAGDTLQFAVSYQVNDLCHWDNNQGRNYAIQCRILAESNGFQVLENLSQVED